MYSLFERFSGIQNKTSFVVNNHSEEFEKTSLGGKLEDVRDCLLF